MAETVFGHLSTRIKESGNKKQHMLLQEYFTLPRFTHLTQSSLHTLPVPAQSSSWYTSVFCAPCYASCWPKMTIDCSATAFVIRLGWILHLNHFIIYVPNSCQCHLEAVWLVIHHTLSFTVVINIVMGWTFTMKLPGGRERRSFWGGRGTQTGGMIIRCSGYQTALQRRS